MTGHTLSRHYHGQFGKTNIIAYAETNSTEFFLKDRKKSERVITTNCETPPVSKIASSFPPVRVSLSYSIVVRIGFFMSLHIVL